MEAVVLDWSGVAPAVVLDVDAVADFGGTWRRVQGTGGRLAFCRQRPYTVTAGSCSSTTTTTTSEPEATTTTLALPPGCAIYEDNHVYSRQDYENGSFFEFDARFDHYEYSGIQTAEMYRVRRCSVGGCSETLERTANWQRLRPGALLLDRRSPPHPARPLHRADLCLRSDRARGDRRQHQPVRLLRLLDRHAVRTTGGLLPVLPRLQRPLRALQGRAAVSRQPALSRVLAAGVGDDDDHATPVARAASPRQPALPKSREYQRSGRMRTTISFVPFGRVLST